VLPNECLRLWWKHWKRLSTWNQGPWVASRDALDKVIHCLRYLLETEWCPLLPFNLIHYCHHELILVKKHPCEAPSIRSRRHLLSFFLWRCPLLILRDGGELRLDSYLWYGFWDELFVTCMKSRHLFPRRVPYVCRAWFLLLDCSLCVMKVKLWRRCITNSRLFST